MFCSNFDNASTTWSGNKKVALYNPNVSVGQVVLNALETNRHKICQISDNNGRQMSKNEMRLKTIAAAKFFQNHGYTKNDLFGVYANNSHHLSPIVFGALTVGIPINTLDPNFKKEELVHMLCLTNPTVMFCDGNNASRLIEAINEVKSKATIFSFEDNVPGTKFVDTIFENYERDEFYLPPAIEDGTKHIAIILCSSGTTGMAKGVSLTHASLLQYSLCLDSSMGEVFFNFSPLFWLTGLMGLLACTINDMQRIITTQSFSCELMLNVIEKYRVNIIISPPSAIAQMLQDPKLETTDLSSVCTYFCGGSKVHDELIQRFNKYLKNGQINVVYGMSETSGGISMNYPITKLGSVGKLTPNITAKVINDNGEMCGINEDGELYLRTQPAFIGYYGNEDETAKLFDKDGFIQTGDIGHFDSDGYLFLVDRKKEILKYRNNQISPSEIESILLNEGSIKNVCVVGIPDLECGELPAAVILKQPNEIIDKEKLFNIVKEKLSDAKQLRGGIYFAESFPLTGSGKILRREIQALAVRLFQEKKNKMFF